MKSYIYVSMKNIAVDKHPSLLERRAICDKENKWW